MRVDQAKRVLKEVQKRCVSLILSDEDLDDMNKAYKKFHKKFPEASRIQVYMQGKGRRRKGSKATKVRRNSSGFAVGRDVYFYHGDSDNRMTICVTFRKKESPDVKGFQKSWPQGEQRFFYYLPYPEDSESS